MKAYRVHLKSWTASFRPPLLIYGYQPTLDVPPFSTIYGLISSACGKYVTPKDVSVGYVFLYKGKGVDLEKIYEWAEKNVPKEKKKEMMKKHIPIPPGKISKTNIISREVLAFTDLFLYLDKEEYAECFRKPVFPLLIGRSSDIAFVEEIKEVELKNADGFYIYPTLLPINDIESEELDGEPHALPVYFDDKPARTSLLTKPFLVIRHKQWYNKKGIVDEEKQWGVIIQQF